MKIAGMTAGKNERTPAGKLYDADFYIKNYYTPAEASAAIGVQIREVHRLAGDGLIETAQHPCGGVLFAKDSVSRYIRDQE